MTRKTLYHVVFGAFVVVLLVVLGFSAYEQKLSLNSFDTAPVEAINKITGQKKTFRNTPAVPFWYEILISENTTKPAIDVHSGKDEDSKEVLSYESAESDEQETPVATEDDPFALPPQEKVFVDPEGRYKLTIPEGVVYIYQPSWAGYDNKELHLWSEDGWKKRKNILESGDYIECGSSLVVSFAKNISEYLVKNAREERVVQKDNDLITVYSPDSSCGGMEFVYIPVTGGVIEVNHPFFEENAEAWFDKIIQGIEIVTSPYVARYHIKDNYLMTRDNVVLYTIPNEFIDRLQADSYQIWMGRRYDNPINQQVIQDKEDPNKYYLRTYMFTYDQKDPVSFLNRIFLLDTQNNTLTNIHEENEKTVVKGAQGYFMETDLVEMQNNKLIFRYVGYESSGPCDFPFSGLYSLWYLDVENSQWGVQPFEIPDDIQKKASKEEAACIEELNYI